MSETSGPLAGLLVVSIEQAVAAPLCTVRLADAGACVIKIERPASGTQRLLLCATPEQDGGLNLEARTANGNVTMKAEAKW